MHCDLVILDELGYLPCSASGGALLFHLLSKLYERTSVIITTTLSFSEWPSVFTGAFSLDFMMGVGKESMGTGQGVVRFSAETGLHT